MKAPAAERPIYPLHEAAGVRCHGLFCVYGEGRRMCISDDPLRDTARGFIKAGIPPNIVLVARHDFGLWDVLTTTLGSSAQGWAYGGGDIQNFRDESTWWRRHAGRISLKRRQ